MQDEAQALKCQSRGRRNYWISSAESSWKACSSTNSSLSTGIKHKLQSSSTTKSANSWKTTDSQKITLNAWMTESAKKVIWEPKSRISWTTEGLRPMHKATSPEAPAQALPEASQQHRELLKTWWKHNRRGQLPVLECQVHLDWLSRPLHRSEGEMPSAWKEATWMLAAIFLPKLQERKSTRS